MSFPGFEVPDKNVDHPAPAAAGSSPSRLSGLLRTAGYVTKYALLFFLLLVFYADSSVRSGASGSLFSHPDDIPYHKVGLLLGTAPYLVRGGQNPFFFNRIDAAVQLFEAGKVTVILASGDNRHPSYNEPLAMRNELIRRGVPGDRIVLDYAGFSTLDSIIRTKEVFGQSEFTVITQGFHAERALYVADHHGIRAVAFRAGDVEGPAMMRMQVREYLARVKVLSDVHLFSRMPRFLGDPVVIP